MDGEENFDREVLEFRLCNLRLGIKHSLDWSLF